MTDQSFGDNLERTASEAAESFQDELNELKREARKRAEDVRKTVAQQLNQAASALRQEVRDSDASSEATQNVDKVAKSLEKAAVYVRRHDLEDMGEDVTRTVKRNPWQTIGIAFVAGLVVGLILRGDGK